MVSDNVFLRQIQRCSGCRLSDTRRSVVLGRGSFPADVLLIGEGPGRSEDTLGQAFIGPAGKLLDWMLEQADVPVNECYFTNTVLCHPTDSLGGENREPQTDEMVACRENINYIIELVQAKAVVLVGDVARRAFKGLFPIHWHITHPSAILRSGGRSSPHVLRNINVLREVGEYTWRQ